MAYTILLNNEEFHLNEDELPCLVHYEAKTGGSQFTVTLVADLFLRGSKILFLTAYPYAKDNFYEQTKGMESEIVCIDKKEDLVGSEKYQAIILKSGNEELYREALQSLKDLDERVVLVKNFEIVNANTIESSLRLEKIIISGDIDKSIAKKQIISKLYKTTVLFSNPEISLSVKAPELEKYTGYLNTGNKAGIVKLEM